MAGKKWRVEEDAFLAHTRQLGLSIPQCRQALEEHFGGRYTVGQVDGRLQRLRVADDPILRLYGDCDMYVLSVMVPWVSAECRSRLDLLQRQESLPIPA